MALTISPYNHSLKLLLNQEIDLTALKVMLLDATAAFDATDTTLEHVAGTGNAKEVDGGGWATGGEALASVAVTVVDTNAVKLDATDINETATGAAIGPASFAVIYDSAHADDAPLFFIDFDGEQEASEGTPFKVTLNAAGLLKIVWAA